MAESLPLFMSHPTQKMIDANARLKERVRAFWQAHPCGTKFSDAFEIARVFDLADFLGDRASDLFASGGRRSGDGIGPFETDTHRAQVGAAGAAKLACLSFFGSAAWAKHSRKIVRLSLLVSSEKDSRSFRSGTCPADFSGGQVRRLNGLAI